MSTSMQEIIFTIGHSTHPQEHFISLLRLYNIGAICDVRSIPYSRVNPQFDREQLKESLSICGIKYVFLGKELGARSEDPECYVNGKVQYDRLAHTDLFRQGLLRVQEGRKKFRLALMCAEKEPLECHRAILVSRYLATVGLEVQHIHADGRIEAHADALNRLARMLHLREDEHDLFRSHEDILAEAYRLQGERIAYDSSVIPANTPSVRSVAG